MTDEVFLQALNPAGEYRPEALGEEYQPYLAQVDEAMLRRFFREMSVVRAFDQEATALQRQGQMGLWIPLEGQEGAQVGSGLAAKSHDFIFPAYREHAVAKIRGVDLIDVIRLVRGVTHGGWDPKAHNFNIYTLVIGSQALHATGYAMGIKYDGLVGTGNPDTDAAVLAYFGDGASSQGDVSEAFVFSASYQSPVVFFMQNNQWAISVPVTTQTRVPFSTRAAGFGLNSVRVDGNDVITSYAVTAKLLDDARAGKGPGFVEAVTYRMGAHTTSDDPTRYEDAAVRESWKAKDPILRLERLLRAEGVEQSFFDEVAAEGADFSADIRRRTLELGVPETATMFEHVYSEEHAVLAEQQQWLADYEATFAEGGA